MDLVLVRTLSITVLTHAIRRTLIDCIVHPYVQYELYLQCYSGGRVFNHPYHSNHLQTTHLPASSTSLTSTHITSHHLTSLCPHPILILSKYCPLSLSLYLSLSSSLSCLLSLLLSSSRPYLSPVLVLCPCRIPSGRIFHRKTAALLWSWSLLWRTYIGRYVRAISDGLWWLR